MGLCPGLTDDELCLLRDSMLAEGCRDPIVCWDVTGTPILDGHHRYEICHGEGLPFKVKLLKLPDRAAARRWILTNQLARRNVTQAQRAILRGRLYREMKTEKGKNPRENPMGHFVPSGNTAGGVAEKEGVSPRTIKRDADFAEAVDLLVDKVPELKEPIERGTIPKGAVKGLTKAPIDELKKLANLEGTQLRKAATKAATKAVTKATTKAAKKPRKPVQVLKSAEQEAFNARAQIKIWIDTIGRWFSNPPSIDDCAKRWPGPTADRVVNASRELLDALEDWKKEIK